MADEIVIDKQLFHERLSNFVAKWKTDKRSGDSIFQGASSIATVVGKQSDPGIYLKPAAFQLWLLGYEFPSTLLIITPDLLQIVTTKKKASYLEPLKGGKVPVEILVRGKDADENKKQFQTCLDTLKKAGKKVAVLKKDHSAGAFAEEWKAALQEAAIKEEDQVDLAPVLSNAALSVKDEKELRIIRDASRASSALMTNYFVEEMSDILDTEKKVTHRTLADKVSNKIDDTKFFEKQKVSKAFDSVQLDWCLQPTVQSGGTYDLKFASEPDDSNLHAGVIISSLGLRYQTYGAMVGRTYMVGPNKEQENAYKLLLAIHELVIKSIKDGVVAKDVYSKALAHLKSKKPEYEKNFVKNVGYGIGTENKDNTLLLSGKNLRVLKDGMTLVVQTGFQDLENGKPQDKKSKSYSLVLTDTVRVGQGDCAVFTKDTASDLDAISFFFNDEEEEEAKPKVKKERAPAIAQTNITKTRTRHERTTNQDAEKEEQRRQHQKELHAKKQQEGLEEYGEDAKALNGTEEKKFKKFESYKRDNMLPTSVAKLEIVVDKKALTVLLPIMGRPVPFHINTIKNASHTPEADFTSLRINFLSPGQGVGRKDDQPFEDPNAHFIRSLTFRSHDIDRIDQITKDITDLKKDVVRRETEKKQLEDVVEQDKLILLKTRKPFMLDLIFIRPALDGKRIPGSVEIHQNGLRYVHGANGSKVEILFSNMKHLFFQPSQHELIVIIHVHLKNPIMLGKKKTKDIQFVREATEMQFDETGNRKRRHKFGDEEEFEQEQEERRRRAALDKEFKNFAEKIADAARNENVSVDIPYRELGFNGVPSRSSVLVQPTTDCLVQLTEPPFTCLTLSEIEIVHLERVQFGLRNFDMVVVFKDYNRPPVHINTIPVESLDPVKDWLDSVDIPFSEGPLNLNWATIMKTVTSDPHSFFADGGWSFLATDSDDEDGQEEEEESAFEVSESELAISDESSEESDFDENASDEMSDEGSEDDFSEGESWDELDKKAAKKDKETAQDEDEDDGKAKKRKR
ncbi:SPT16-domain-containing protein [Dothidotthia symphoricarpi CBS 119687]|uniref:FACT complex subunit n=1 Tax=Dothidotthia symphoricarpi CBS 119687 TaxID=1392245 RepID=A0A6A6AJR3_9PLEO|nr:SPT16-domain-containing protein [Dothidotthia symphoricarpi CBS 119687]KAF2132040.1 SPT16-domain-containing protein [Dothidotthia symphoricarpi CBS 119687]